MSIPKYRYMEYTDDGCCLYQCLNCYNEWESRTDPEYGWHWCPYCGIKWESKQEARRATIEKWRWLLYVKDYDDRKISYSERENFQNMCGDDRDQRIKWSLEYLYRGKWQIKKVLVAKRNCDRPMFLKLHKELKYYREQYPEEVWRIRVLKEETSCHLQGI